MENKDPSFTKLDEPMNADSNKSAQFSHTLNPEDLISQTEAVLTPSLSNGSASKSDTLLAADNNTRSPLGKHSVRELNGKTDLDNRTVASKTREQCWTSSLAIVGCTYFLIMASGLSPYIIGLRLSALSTIANVLPPVNYVEAKIDYADYLQSKKQYKQAAAIYSSIIQKIKTTNMDKQLLSLVNLDLAQAIIENRSNTNNEAETEKARRLVKEALNNIGEPTPNTPRQLLYTLVDVGEDFIDRDDPNTASPLIWTASRFWKTGPIEVSEGNTFADLGCSLRKKHQWASAYKAFEHAFSITKSWGDGNYNVYRLCQMGFAKAKMNGSQEAVDLFSRAIAMDQRLHKGGLDWGLGYLTTYLDSLIKLKRLDEANDILTKFSVLMNVPNYYDYSKRLAEAYARNNQLGKTRAVFSNMLKDDRLNTPANVAAVKTILANLENNKNGTAKILSRNSKIGE